MKILVVDDNSDDRKFLRINLKQRGCEVIEASDGKEGLDLARQHRPDLVISDALMPNMDGFQFLKALKTDRDLRSIPFIFYSAIYAGYKEAELAISLGAEEFMIKPKDPNEFWKDLTGILEECRLKGTKELNTELIIEEEYLKKYSQIVATKLEEKVIELEKVRAQLSATQERLEHLVSSSPSVVYSLDPSTKRITFISENVTWLLGHTVQDFMDVPHFWETHVHPDDFPKVQQDLMLLLKEGHYISEYRFRHKDGSYRWIRDEAKTHSDNEGNVIEIIGSLINITERRQAEEALKESEEKYRILVDNALAGVYRATIDGKFLYVNDALARIFEYDSPEEMCKEAVLARYRTTGEREDFIHLLKKSRKITNYELEIQTKTGKTRNILISANLEGEIVSGMMLDVTEKKRLEIQLRHAQKMEAIGQLAGGIAHDFNNILTAIIGYANILKMKMTDDDPLRLNVDHILTASERAANLTQSLLAFSRKQVMSLRYIDLNSIIRGIEKFLSRIIGEDIAIRTELSNQELTIYADRGQIEQVLMNLATNARDAMPSGGTLLIETGVTILGNEFVRAHDYGKPGKYAMITVSDTGTGISENMKSKIFEPFFTTKEVGKGTGLGLAVVYGIVKQHEGFINCYSEHGKGTTFRIYLPMIDKKEELIKEESEKTITAIQKGTETVLVAEDDDSLRKLSRTVLGEFGYNVIEAVNGEDAVLKFIDNKDKINLLIFDLIMPKKNGKEACDEIRKIAPGIKVIFLSGYPADIIKQRGMIDNESEFIFKPVSPIVLLKKVREILDR